jgi:hypothetical protein
MYPCNYDENLEMIQPVMESSHAEYSADHSALFRRNSWNLHYRSSG